MRIYLLIAIACLGCAKPVEPVAVEQPTFQTAPVIEHNLSEQGRRLKSVEIDGKDVAERLKALEKRVDEIEYQTDRKEREEWLKENRERERAEGWR